MLIVELDPVGLFISTRILGNITLSNVLKQLDVGCVILGMVGQIPSMLFNVSDIHELLCISIIANVDSFLILKTADTEFDESLYDVFSSIAMFSNEKTLTIKEICSDGSIITKWQINQGGASFE